MNRLDLHLCKEHPQSRLLHLAFEWLLEHKVLNLYNHLRQKYRDQSKRCASPFFFSVYTTVYKVAKTFYYSNLENCAEARRGGNHMFPYLRNSNEIQWWARVLHKIFRPLQGQSNYRFQKYNRVYQYHLMTNQWKVKLGHRSFNQFWTFKPSLDLP